MGRIKSALVKRTTNSLVSQPGFSSDFEKNKKLLVGIMPSKRIKNMVAGFISRVKKREELKKQANTKQ